MATRIAALAACCVTLACVAERAEDSAFGDLSAGARAARELCVTIGGDTTRVPVDTYALPGQSAESAAVEVTQPRPGIERISVTYIRDTSRLSQYFAFRGDTLICAEERSERHDRPLNGAVAHSSPTAIVFDGRAPSWFWALTRADSLAGKPDSLTPTAARLAADADSLRRWVTQQRAARRTSPR